MGCGPLGLAGPARYNCGDPMNRMGNWRNFRVACLACWVSVSPALGQQAARGEIKITVLEGAGAIHQIRGGTGKAPLARVEDQDGRPVAGAIVTFTLPEMGASGVFPNRSTVLTVPTDPKGQAWAQGLRPNNVAGEYRVQVSASHEGRTARATITLINAAAPVSGKRSRTALLLGVVAGGAAAGGLVAVTRGKTSGPATPAPRPSTTIAAGSPSFGPP